jgi:hypothetical protein
MITREEARALGLYVVDIHFNRQREKEGFPWTVHYQGKCLAARHVVFGLRVYTETRERPDLPTNPRYFVRVLVREVKELEPGVYFLRGMPCRRGSRGGSR